LPFVPIKKHALATILLKTFQQLCAQHATNIKRDGKRGGKEENRTTLLCISIKVQSAIHLHQATKLRSTTKYAKHIEKFTSAIDLTRLSHLFR